MPLPEILLIASSAALAVGLSFALTYFRRIKMIRASAQRIAANYRNLSHRPQWTPLTLNEELPEAVAAGLISFESACAKGLGFLPLGRLSESNSEGSFLGFHTALVNADGTVVAGFACAHPKRNLTFRSFASRGEHRLLITSEARTVFERSDRIVFQKIAKGSEENEILRRHLDLLVGETAPLCRFEVVEDYVALQNDVWEASHARRNENDYSLSMETLRQLLPGNEREQTLRLIHRELERIRRRRSKTESGAAAESGRAGAE